MRFNLLVLLFFAFACTSIFAQKRPMSPDEYIQSATTLRTGERVVSRRTSEDQLTRIAQIPSRSEYLSRANQVNEGRGSTLPGNDARDLETRTAQRPVQAQATGYPYPAATQPRTAQLTPAQAAGYNAQTRPTNSNVRQTAYQAAGLNNNSIRTAQNCNCPPTTGGFQVPPTTTPGFTYQPIQAAAQPVPQGNLFVPGTNVNGQTIAPPALQFNNGNVCCQPTPGVQLNGVGQGFNTFGNAGTGRFGNGWFQNWSRPLVTGSGAYQPIIDLQGFKPGTYLGKGIIGQPTAYVQYQPLRNLLRYLFP